MSAGSSSSTRPAPRPLSCLRNSSPRHIAAHQFTSNKFILFFLSRFLQLSQPGWMAGHPVAAEGNIPLNPKQPITCCQLKSSSNFGHRTIMFQRAEKAVLSVRIRATPPALNAPSKRARAPITAATPSRTASEGPEHTHSPSRSTEVLPAPACSQHGCAAGFGLQFSPSISSSWPCAVDVCF